MGFGPHGGYQEYVPVVYQQLITVTGNLSPLSLAPLTDAGLTPYRGLKNDSGRDGGRRAGRVCGPVR